MNKLPQHCEFMARTGISNRNIGVFYYSNAAARHTATYRKRMGRYSLNNFATAAYCCAEAPF